MRHVASSSLQTVELDQNMRIQYAFAINVKYSGEDSVI